MGIDSGKGMRTGERVPRGDLGSESGGKSGSGKSPERTGAWLLKMHLLGSTAQHLKMQVYCSSQVGGGGVRDIVRLL